MHTPRKTCQPKQNQFAVLATNNFFATSICKNSDIQFIATNRRIYSHLFYDNFLRDATMRYNYYLCETRPITFHLFLSSLSFHLVFFFSDISQARFLDMKKINNDVIRFILYRQYSKCDVVIGHKSNLYVS